MKRLSSENPITGVLLRLAILACGVGGITAALFAAAGALEHRVPPPATDGAKVGPTFAAREASPAPRVRAAEPSPPAPVAVVTPGATLPVERAPAATSFVPVPRQDASAAPTPPDTGVAKSAPRQDLTAAPAIDTAGQQQARTRPVSATPVTAALEPARRPVVGDDGRPDPSTMTPAGLPAGASPATTPSTRAPRGALGCTQYRSYDPRTGTYRGFDGKVRECNAVAGN